MTTLHRFDANAVVWSPHPRFPEIHIKVLQTRAANPHASLMLVELAPGGVIEPHFHPIETETVFVLQGEAVLLIDANETPLAAQAGAAIPPQTTHSLRNTGSDPLHLLAVHTPPVL